MIEKLIINKKFNYQHLVNFCLENYDYDFYITDNNSRLYITDVKSLKKLFKESINVYIERDRDDYKGVIMIWKSEGGGKKRYYVKLNAIDSDSANKLLTTLLWNSNRELFVKIRKESKFMKVFKNKGFHFEAGRGIQFLLKRRSIKEKEKHEYTTNRH